MTRAAGGHPGADPDLDLVELVLIDGDNLLHAVRGGRDAGGVAWLLPRLASWRPPGLSVIVALDGHADRGLGDQRPIAPGISVRHAGMRSADDLIVSLVEARPYAERARTVVVTDDGRLRERVRRGGGIGRRLDWLIAQLAGSGGSASHDARPTSIGRRASTQRPAETAADSDDEAARPWQPGRGATRKSGNPKRAPRRGRRT